MDNKQQIEIDVIEQDFNDASLDKPAVATKMMVSNITIKNATAPPFYPPTYSTSSSAFSSANCSPLGSPTITKRNNEEYRQIALNLLEPPIHYQNLHMNFTEEQLAHCLRRYIVDPNLLRVYGFPVESAVHTGCIEIYKCLPKPMYYPTRDFNYKRPLAQILKEDQKVQIDQSMKKFELQRKENQEMKKENSTTQQKVIFSQQLKEEEAQNMQTKPLINSNIMTINKQQRISRTTTTNPFVTIIRNHKPSVVIPSNVINESDGLFIERSKNNNNSHDTEMVTPPSTSDSGQASGGSTPPSVDAETVEEETITGLTAFYTPDGDFQVFSNYDQSVQKQCVRCNKGFIVTQDGEYLTRETCSFHWGKLVHMYNGRKCYESHYSCCLRDSNEGGCVTNQLHVWTGAVVGLNGPYRNFVCTLPRYYNKCNGFSNVDDDSSFQRSHTEHPKIFALDCEMSYTAFGLEITKITVVGFDGKLVYEHFVKPDIEIVDYNTRYSGITEKDLSPDSNNSVKSLREVQSDLLQLFDSDTILIGHGLENDLRALRIVHKTIIDTSVTFPHTSGFPYRRALKSLTKLYLNRDIQCSDNGHSSFEDSRACLELMLWRLRQDLITDIPI